MATKKQKRAAAEAKRVEFMAKIKVSGLAAQKADQAKRRTQEENNRIEARRINLRHRQILVQNGINPDTGIHEDVEAEYNFSRPVVTISPYPYYSDLLRVQEDLAEWAEIVPPFSHLSKSGT